MKPITKTRIASIDLLKGIVMVIMALDHTRDYLHLDAYLYDPSDPTQSNLPLFFTRFITNFCAPAFSFLAGSAAFLVGLRKTKRDLSFFLLKRGLWLIFIEMTIVNFAWFFDIYFQNPGLLVIWVLGISMITLAGLVHFSNRFILLFSCVMIIGHNLLDNVHFGSNFLWVVLHERAVYAIKDQVHFYVEYPIIPWIAVMSLGYYFGSLYSKDYPVAKRKKILHNIGCMSLLLFLILRFTNLYGDAKKFIHFDDFSKSLMSFLQVSKYPPSFLYLLLTLGFVFLFLANTEKLKGAVVAFFCCFGRVPFFYYIIHLFFIHFVAMIFAAATGFGWRAMILPDWLPELPALKGFGFPLWVVYLVWISIILLLYPVCKWFDHYKQTHKEKWWLSYL